MTSSRRFFVAACVVAMLPAQGTAEEVLGGPTLGVVLDETRRVLRPVLGVPGAALLGDPLPLDFEIEKAAIAPDGSFALVRPVGAPELRIVRANAEGHSASTIEGALDEASSVLLSPSASSAAIYSADLRRLQILSGLPAEPVVDRDIDLSTFPGELTAIAVSDDARTVLVSLAQDESAHVWSFPKEGDPKSVLAAKRVTSINLLAGAADALVADEAGMTVFLLNGDNASIPVAGEQDGITSPTTAIASADRKLVIIAEASSGRVVIMNTEDGARQELVCTCAPEGLTRMGEGAVYRLNALSGGPLWLLDAGASEPRLVFVPPDGGGEE